MNLVRFKIQLVSIFESKFRIKEIERTDARRLQLCNEMYEKIIVGFDLKILLI